jgi:hypothetical protein
VRAERSCHHREEASTQWEVVVFSAFAALAFALATTLKHVSAGDAPTCKPRSKDSWPIHSRHAVTSAVARRDRMRRGRSGLSSRSPTPRRTWARAVTPGQRTVVRAADPPTGRTPSTHTAIVALLGFSLRASRPTQVTVAPGQAGTPAQGIRPLMCVMATTASTVGDPEEGSRKQRLVTERAIDSEEEQSEYNREYQDGARGYALLSPASTKRRQFRRLLITWPSEAIGSPVGVRDKCRRKRPA